ELVRDRFEEELARDRLLRFCAEAFLELRAAHVRQLQVRVRVDAALLQRTDERLQELPRAHLDRQSLRIDVRRPHELVDRGLPELPVRLLLAALADATLAIDAPVPQPAVLGHGLRT